MDRFGRGETSAGRCGGGVGAALSGGPLNRRFGLLAAGLFPWAVILAGGFLRDLFHRRGSAVVLECARNRLARDGAGAGRHGIKPVRALGPLAAGAMSDALDGALACLFLSARLFAAAAFVLGRRGASARHQVRCPAAFTRQA